MQNLVTFPPVATPECGYEDDHEGLQVYLVVPEPQTQEPNGLFECFTQVLTVLVRPEVPLTETDLWDTWAEEQLQRKRRAGIRKVLEQHGTQAQREALMDSVPQATLSTPVLASVILGTRSEAVAYPDGSMWSAGCGDLTQAGKVLYDTLKAAYGVEPVLVTLLET